MTSSPTPSADEQSARVHGAKEAVIVALRTWRDLPLGTPLTSYIDAHEKAWAALDALDALSK